MTDIIAENKDGFYPDVPEKKLPKDGKLIYKPLKGYTYNPLLKLPRNMPCPCLSGKKFKKCCLPTLPGAIKTAEAKIISERLSEIKAGKYCFDRNLNQIKRKT